MIWHMWGGFTLEYDASALADPQVILGGAVSDSSVLTVNSEHPGRIGVVVDSTEAFVSSREPARLVIVTFKRQPNSETSEPVFVLTDSLVDKGFSDADGNTIAIRSAKR